MDAPAIRIPIRLMPTETARATPAIPVRTIGSRSDGDGLHGRPLPPAEHGRARQLSYEPNGWPTPTDGIGDACGIG
jgi:hypothetical protein